MPRILVKAAPGLSAMNLKLGAAAVPYTVAPLFQSIGADAALGAAPEDFAAVKRLSVGLGVSFSYLLIGEDDTRSGTIPAISEVFSDGGSLFDGWARITVQRLIPKTEKETKP